MKIAVLIAPFATMTPDEVLEIDRVQLELVEAGILAVFFPDATERVLDDSIAAHRELGLQAAVAFVKMVAANDDGEAHQVGTRLTEGMAREIEAWAQVTNRRVIVHP